MLLGSFTGQLLEYDDMDERLESDVEHLASELDNRLCMEANSSDGDDDDDDDCSALSQVRLQSCTTDDKQQIILTVCSQ